MLTPSDDRLVHALRQADGALREVLALVSDAEARSVLDGGPAEASVATGALRAALRRGFEDAGHSAMHGHREVTRMLGLGS